MRNAIVVSTANGMSRLIFMRFVRAKTIEHPEMRINNSKILVCSNAVAYPLSVTRSVAARIVR